MIAAESLEVMQMQVQDTPYRQAVFDEAKYISLNPMQRYVYLREFMAAMDYKTNMAWSQEQGMAEGMAKGSAKGLVKGELKNLFSLIQKKFQKGKTLSETASELEDTEEHLLPSTRLYSSIRIFQPNNWPICS